MRKPKDDLATLMNASLETANQDIKKRSPQIQQLEKSRAQKKTHNSEILTRRSTIAFHSADLVRIGSILDHLLDGSGKRGTLSDAVKIALALCPLSKDKITKAFFKIQEQDGRRRP